VTLIPHFVQNQIQARDANLLSAFNWCSAADHILPFAGAIVSAADQAHLWGLYAGIAVAGAVDSVQDKPFIANPGHMMTR